MSANTIPTLDELASEKTVYLMDRFRKNKDNPELLERILTVIRPRFNGQATALRRDIIRQLERIENGGKPVPFMPPPSPLRMLMSGGWQGKAFLAGIAVLIAAKIYAIANITL
ncbi:MAG: hypothetical protein AAFQ45_13860 [Pseudomonadota bacterium]